MEQTRIPAHRSSSFFWSSHGNPEREQAALRVSMGGVVLLGYAAFAWLRPSAYTSIAVGMIALYVAYGVLGLWVVRGTTRGSPLWLAASTVADQFMLALFLGIGGPVSLPLLWVMFWFLIGSGCRYGKSTLAVSCVTALLGIAALSLWQPWWQANRPAALGLALSVTGVSVYLSVLVDRLSRANRELARRAGTDPLTGLSNRYALEEIVGRTVTAISDGNEGASALMLIDLDGFKEVNDTHGHAVGDVLLKTFAEALTRRIRTTDTVARLGGDEFVVLARHVSDRTAVRRIASSIHAALADITQAQGQPVKVSASIGACLISGLDNPEQADIVTLMRAADRAMYRAKTLGHAQTVFAEAHDFSA
jgi:diguanylate cyclase (GGDEF)-like protein